MYALRYRPSLKPEFAEQAVAALISDAASTYLLRHDTAEADG